MFGTSREGWRPDLPDAGHEPFIPLLWLKVHELLGRVPEGSTARFVKDGTLPGEAQGGHRYRMAAERRPADRAARAAAASRPAAISSRQSPHACMRKRVGLWSAASEVAMADPADLEQLAIRLEQSGDYRILRRVPVVTRYADDDPAAVKRLGLIVDIETTGLDPASDRIIELACLPFHFSSEGVLYDVLPGYAGFEDPGQPLHEEVVRLTGITDDQLLGQKLDEQAVDHAGRPPPT